jgi:threonine synthase
MHSPEQNRPHEQRDPSRYAAGHGPECALPQRHFRSPAREPHTLDSVDVDPSWTGRSTLSHLEGSLSGERYDAGSLIGPDPVDGRPLLARYDLDRARETLSVESLAGRRRGGMWRWGEALPVADPARIVFLGEGSTPLVPASRLGGAARLPNVSVKAESLNPTGSFKARGIAAAVSRAVELGVRAFVMPSAGNAGGALAAYGAAAGVDVTVVMPTDAPEANTTEVLACGARLILVDGLISDCGRISSRVAGAAGAFDLSTLREPYRLEGKKTLGFELAEDRGWRLPDVIVYPTGGGTGLIGMWKAFAELEELGLIDGRRPRMIAVQSEGCAPIVRAFEEGSRFAAPLEAASTRASGLRVPGSIGDFLILDALQQSGGGAVAVSEEAIVEGQRLAGSHGLGYVSPESGAAVAALMLLRERGLAEPNDEVVVFDTGAGTKYPSPPRLPEIEVLEADVDEKRIRLIAARLSRSQDGG